MLRSLVGSEMCIRDRDGSDNQVDRVYGDTLKKVGGDVDPLEAYLMGHGLSEGAEVGRVRGLVNEQAALGLLVERIREEQAKFKGCRVRLGGEACYRSVMVVEYCCGMERILHDVAAALKSLQDNVAMAHAQAEMSVR
eukprot:TRINITY_DN2685_c0_g1_i5.p1 TRINITY_DN2685_c0_g1~~TRINITY_DN2685_c0_g1_i5.p1  ORF type:complete len:138 (+),score=39.74 TRINITY_DN2685_c0_g1_i5:132-545(+)